MKPTFKHSPDTQEGRIERSVYILRDPRGFMADKQDFLLSKGVTTSEFLTALNIASNGELLEQTHSENRALVKQKEKKDF